MKIFRIFSPTKRYYGVESDAPNNYERIKISSLTGPNNRSIVKEFDLFRRIIDDVALVCEHMCEASSLQRPPK